MWSEDNAQEPVSVRLEVLEGRTDRAIQVREPDPSPFDPVWLPLSQIEHVLDEDGDPIGLDVLEEGDVCTFELPAWLAEREGWA